VIEGAVLMWSGRVDDGVAVYESAVAQEIAYVGPDDLEVAQLLGDYAASLLEVNRVAPALDVARRADKIIQRLEDATDDRIDQIRVNIAAVLIAANRQDEALPLLETARANNVKRLGETNTVIANIDLNLAVIYNARRDDRRALDYLHAALETDEKLLGPDHVEVASVAYTLGETYCLRRDYARAIGAALRAAKIYAAASLGSDRHRTALTLAAQAANEMRDFRQALALTAEALGFARPAENPQTPAWTQLERARALLGLHRAAEARPLLVAARASFAGLRVTQRVEQIDSLLTKIPR
jgi:tetratricopeptide (TPR) repeat protein